MNPVMATTPLWQAITAAAGSLALGVGTIVVAALFLLLGRAVIPSFLFTGSIPPRAAVFRPVFDGLALVTLLAAAVCFWRAALLAGPALQTIFPRWWI